MAASIALTKGEYAHRFGVLTYLRGGAGKAVLFLHGAGVCAATQREALSLLAERYDVIAPDLPGFGGSFTPPRDFGWKEYMELLEGLLRSLGIEQVAVIGVSLGGGIALRLAIASKRVARLIVSDSAGIPPKEPYWRLLSRFFYQKTLHDIALYGDIRPLRTMARDVFANYLRRAKEWPRIVRLVRTFSQEPFSEFKTIGIPTLILWGDRDEIFPPAYAEEFHRAISGSVVRYVMGNHDWLVFKPKPFAEAVREWLKKTGY